jgi:hypothetical protein
MAKPPTHPEPPHHAPGRPRADEPGASVSTWLRAEDHDRLIRLAQQHDMPVSALVRRLLELKLR